MNTKQQLVLHMSRIQQMFFLEFYVLRGFIFKLVYRTALFTNYANCVKKIHKKNHIPNSLNILWFLAVIPKASFYEHLKTKLIKIPKH